MLVNLSINPQQTTDQLVDFIKQTLKNAGFSRLVIGLSGGIDSGTSLALGAKAIGAKNIYPGIFPYGELNKKGTEDAELIIEKFKIPPSNVSLIDIKPLVDPIIDANQRPGLKREKGPALINIRRGNIMVRLRMILLYDLAKKYNALVLGTENKTERLLGYFTRFGDEASDIEPIASLYKTQVKQLANYLKIPEKIVNQPPTAGMWAGQTDEEEFGFSYEDADQILYFYADKKLSVADILKRGFKKGTIDRVVKRLKDNSFKHNLPYISY